MNAALYYLYLAFFLSHIPITLLVDSQAGARRLPAWRAPQAHGEARALRCASAACREAAPGAARQGGAAAAASPPAARGPRDPGHRLTPHIARLALAAARCSAAGGVVPAGGAGRAGLVLCHVQGPAGAWYCWYRRMMPASRRALMVPAGLHAAACWARSCCCTAAPELQRAVLAPALPPTPPADDGPARVVQVAGLLGAGAAAALLLPGRPRLAGCATPASRHHPADPLCSHDWRCSGRVHWRRVVLDRQQLASAPATPAQPRSPWPPSLSPHAPPAGRKNWIRIPSILYGAFVSATMLPILAELAVHRGAPAHGRAGVLGGAGWGAHPG